MNSTQAVALEHALDWINSNFNPFAIIVSGSIIRGNSDKNSDFDIYVIHDAPGRQRIQKRFNTVPCEIFVNNPQHIHDYFVSELANNRPVTANMIATGKVLKGSDDQRVFSLIEDAKKFMLLSPQLSPEKLLLRKYTLANLFEDATDLLDTDPATSLYILDKMMLEMVELIFLLHQHPLPRIKDRINILVELVPVAGILVNQYYTEVLVNRKYEIAKELILKTTGETGFFEWRSMPE